MLLGAVKMEQVRDKKDTEGEDPDKTEERNRGLKSQEENCHIFKLHFIDYAITVVPIFTLCPPPPSNPHSLRQSAHHGSCPRTGSLATPFPILYFTYPQLFCNYLFVLLNPLTSSHIHPHPASIFFFLNKSL